MEEITQELIRDRKIKIQKQGLKLTENNTTYNAADDDEKTVGHRTHTSITVT